MDIPSFLEPQFNICISSDVQEPHGVKINIFGDEQVGDFSLTCRCIHVLKTSIQREGCMCAVLTSQYSKNLWSSMYRFSRERFWTMDPPPITSLFGPEFSLLECDFEVAFDSLGLIMLNMVSGSSFLHINSGTGYACTIATSLLGPGCPNHGVEFRSVERKKANHILDCLKRLHSGLESGISLPMYHARFPANLQFGNHSKFDYVLCTICFETVDDALILRDFLNPSGVAVAGFAGDIEGGRCVGIIVVSNRVQSKDLSAKSGHKDGQFYRIHPLSDGSLRGVVRHVSSIAQKLELDLTNDQPLERSVPPLRVLTAHTLGKYFNPIMYLRGHSSFILRPPPRQKLQNLSIHMRIVSAAFQGFRSESIASADSTELGSSSRHVEVLDSLADLISSLDDVGELYFGRERFYLWKKGVLQQFPICKGVAAWRLLQMYHIAQFSGVRKIMSTDIQNSVSSSDKSVTLVQPLISGFEDFFRRFNASKFLQQAPWSFQLTFFQQMRRTVTRLIARALADIILFRNLFRCMLTADRLDADLRNLGNFLDALACRAINEVIDLSSNVLSLEAILECFNSLRVTLDALYINAIRDISKLENIEHLLFFAKLTYRSVTQNVVCVGQLQKNSAAAQKLLGSLTGNGSLVDNDLLWKEMETLSALYPVENIADICNVFIRRFVSDLKEFLWAIESEERRNQLVKLEENSRRHYLFLLEPYLSFSDIEKTLNAMS